MYADPSAPGLPVGFGTLDLSADWGELTGGRPHPYIPLLSVLPGMGGRGYGEAVVRHLAAEAVLLVRRADGCDDRLLLDVYESSVAAVRLYTRCDFRAVDVGRLLTDPDDGDRPYVIMAKGVRLAPPGEPATTPG